LDEFSIDFGSLHVSADLCRGVPFDALAWVPAPVSAVGNSSLVEGISELSARWPAE
jgi:hypothetical protein